MSRAMAGGSIRNVGLGLLLAVHMASAAWLQVAPRSTSLPSGEPPSSFVRRDHTIDPVGVSDGLNARPALLHTNKFYSNFVVSRGVPG